MPLIYCHDLDLLITKAAYEFSRKVIEIWLFRYTIRVGYI